MKEWKLVFFLTLAALVLRTLYFWLFTNELVIGGDQMQNIMLACHLAEGDFYGVLHPYWTPLYPIIIGSVTYFINSLILPSVIISILAGSIAVSLTYYLVKQSYGRRESVIAAVIAIFYPHLLTSVFRLGTENLYLVWILGALIVGWRGLKSSSATEFLFTGILLGFAYLTRPEAFAYPIFFGALAIGKSWRLKQKPLESLLIPVGALLLGFAILATPYILYLRTATGAWTISDKTKINTVAAELGEEKTEEGNESNNSSRTINFQNGKVVVHVVAVNLIIIHKSFPSLLPPFLLIFVALGLFRERWNREKLLRESYLIIFCLITILGYALSTVQIRYFYILLPIFFGWIARGVVQAEKWLQETNQNWRPHRFFDSPNNLLVPALSLFVIYFYVFPLNFYIRDTARAWQEVAYEERAAGLWLKKNSKTSPLIFSASRRPVFYAEGKQLSPTKRDMREILTEIKTSQVDYVITSDRSLKRNPYLSGLTEILQNAPEFDLVYQQEEYPGYKIYIFKLK